MKFFAKYFVTIFGIGFSPVAPGTMGSIFAIVTWVIVINLLSIYYFYIIFFIILIISFKLISIYINDTKKDDPPEVVIDEFIGQSLPLLFMMEFDFFEIILAFATFRFFDIYKIYPINKSENIRGSMGIILDDVLAGIYSVIIIMLYKLLVLG